MDKKFNVHVGMNHPSKYTHLVRNSSFNTNSDPNECSNDTFNLNSQIQLKNSNNSKFNITVGNFNPKISKFKPQTSFSILKKSKSNISSTSSSVHYPQETNFHNLSSLSSYDFSKLGSNSTNKYSPISSFAKKSVTFSSILVSSSDSIDVDNISSLGSQNNFNLSTQSSKFQDSEADSSNKFDRVNSKDLLQVFRNVVKNVINVNRLTNVRNDYSSGFFGAESLENVGFGDYMNNQESLNNLDSIGYQPLMNKISNDSLSNITIFNKRHNNDLTSKFNIKLVKIKKKHEFVQKLLDELGDPLKLIKNDAPLSNIMDEHVNTTRLVHPFYINYYPKKIEIEEEEFDSHKLCKSTAKEKKNFRIEDYPSLLSIFTNPKNGITSTLQPLN